MDLTYQPSQIQIQRQKQILTVRMQQSLNILQMPLLELRKKISEEMIENPVLETDTDDFETGYPVGNMEGAGSAPPETADGTAVEPPLFLRDFSASAHASRSDGQIDPLSVLSEERTFSDCLLKQLSEVKTDTVTEKICRYLIASLDEGGYLRETPVEIAFELKTVDLDSIRKAIALIQHMEPAGVGASCLSECILLQLRRMNYREPALFEIADSCLYLVAENRIKKIAERLNISIADAQRYCDCIRKLNPIPSNGFKTGAGEKFIIPEAIIQVDRNGDIQIQYNDFSVQKLSINPYYRNLAEQTDDRETKAYLEAKLKRAAYLIHDVSSRKRTIERILEQIVRLQPLYFLNGPVYLKPMSMKLVADMLGLNESTVSRALQNKSILCPFGTVILKSLFTSTLSLQDDNSPLSPVGVKQKIRELIAAEDKVQPLSDQELTSELNRCGIIISRRTVAKYRDQLQVPSSSLRKRYSV
ncbi:RNA polymerase factor sigma-54 [Paenibacillus lutimineralis]|uniref:RNA polymerase sigma-54 factor n=1 Tax=Paenibacillus lutimineralis TaxID=2707005 RepID=A0A3Q9IB84_9BACL|nr:RNA polymerase factor sigma-54 [Paenibacillus lutimineralis]AZS14302.1 RNA polymerase sigma-54 factor [Paenibacillus lutimineralis]